MLCSQILLMELCNLFLRSFGTALRDKLLVFCFIELCLKFKKVVIKYSEHVKLKEGEAL